VVVSVILNDIPFFSLPLESLIMNTEYNTLLSELTVLHLNIFGIPAEMSGEQIVVGERSFYFAYGCLGIRHLSLFAGFILAYFGKFSHKLLYILVGFFILTLANISRATVIGIAVWLNPRWFDMVHEYGTMIILYTTIFLLWVVWSKKIKGL
jgi:exosortase/archaeosortase family protein